MQLNREDKENIEQIEALVADEQITFQLLSHYFALRVQRVTDKYIRSPEEAYEGVITSLRSRM